MASQNSHCWLTRANFPRIARHHILWRGSSRRVWSAPDSSRPRTGGPGHRHWDFAQGSPRCRSARDSTPSCPTDLYLTYSKFASSNACISADANSSPQPVSHTGFDIDLLGDCDVVVSELCRRAGWNLQHHMIPADEKVEITPLEGHESRHVFKVVGA